MFCGRAHRSWLNDGDCLISESVKQEAGDILRIDDKKEIMPKGAGKAMTVYEVGGIGGPYNLVVEDKDPAMVTLVRKIPTQFAVLGGKHVGKRTQQGHLIRLSRKNAEFELKEPIAILANLKMNLENVTGELAAKDFYAKIITPPTDNGNRQLVRFTSVPPEVDGYFQAHLQYGEEQDSCT